MHDGQYSITRRLIAPMVCCFGNTGAQGKATLGKASSPNKNFYEGGLRIQGRHKETFEKCPLITVVTVVYNDAANLENTIKSVVFQDYGNVEYIIIDGGSTDGTLDILKKYEHAIDYWVSEPDDGIYDAMNKGIDLATGQWINFMNSGDEFAYLDVISGIDFSLFSEVSLIYGDKIQNGSIVRALPLTNIKLGIIHACHQSMFFRINIEPYRSLRYNCSYPIYADYDFVAKYYNKSLDFKYVDRPIAVFKGGGVSSFITRQKRKDKLLAVIENFGYPPLFKIVLNKIVSRFKSQNRE